MENGVGWQIFTGELEWGATGGPLSCIVTIVTNYTIRVSITDPKSTQFAPWEQLSPNVTQGVLVPCRFFTHFHGLQGHTAFSLVLPVGY